MVGFYLPFCSFLRLFHDFHLPSVLFALTRFCYPSLVCVYLCLCLGYCSVVIVVGLLSSLVSLLDLPISTIVCLLLLFVNRPIVSYNSLLLPFSSSCTACLLFTPVPILSTLCCHFNRGHVRFAYNSAWCQISYYAFPVLPHTHTLPFIHSLS